MSRIYVFTGKGGVGKSSVAAAHALKSAEERKRTLLVSTDMAHNLCDIFEKELGRDIENVLPNLDVYEIDPQHVMEAEYADISKYVGMLLGSDGSVNLQDLGMIPGTEELFSLLRIAAIHEAGTYERIIVDCAPTGETLSLLKFPELLSWYMEKLFPIGKVGVRALAPVSKKLFEVEMPNKNAMNDIERIYLKLVGLQDLLRNRDITSIRIVTTPAKMVVEETKRNYMYMNLFDFNVDGLYINRILPADVGNPFFDQWREIQREQIGILKATFSALPIREIPWYDEELKGVRNIKRIVRDVLDREDAFEVRTITERERFEKTEDGYCIKVALPGADKADIDLYQATTDIVIKAGNLKRNVPLPNALRSYAIAGAKFDDDWLVIRFVKENDEAAESI